MDHLPKVLVFHGIVPDKFQIAFKGLGVISQSAFFKQMEYVNNQFHILHPEEFIEIIEHNNSFPRRSILLTFDDGYQNVLDYAVPIIESLGIPIITFISDAHLDNKEWLWFSRLFAYEISQLKHKDELKREFSNENIQRILEILEELAAPDVRLMDKTYHILFDGMDSEQLCDAVKRGFVTVGGHTVRHVKLINESRETRWREIVENKENLERIIGVPVRLFAYPEGLWNLEIAEEVRRAGYIAAFTTAIPRPEIPDELLQYSLPRTGIHLPGRLYLRWRLTNIGPILRNLIHRGAHNDH